MESTNLDKTYQKAIHFCRYRERCHAEVRSKLYGYKLRKADVETLLSRLIEDGHLNEERFALQYASGKFRINKWGRVKIREGLKQKKLSPYCIDKALTSLPEDEYATMLERVASTKWRGLSDGANRKQRLKNYLLQKGYEYRLINQLPFFN